MKSAFKKIDDAEIVDIELMDELKNPINSNIGFR